MIQADLIIEGAAELVTLAGGNHRPRRGDEMRELRIIHQGALAARRGKIVWVGSTADLLTAVKPVVFSKLISAYGKTVMPGLVDPHTHLVFAGSRENEFAMRIQGKTYPEIAAAGGGINATVAATRTASKDDLRAGGRIVLDRMLTLGTTKTTVLDDQWTVVTADGSRAAHWEHTVAATDDGPRILTAGR